MAGIRRRAGFSCVLILLLTSLKNALKAPNFHHRKTISVDTRFSGSKIRHCISTIQGTSADLVDGQSQTELEEKPFRNGKNRNLRSFRRRQGVMTKGQRAAFRDLWPKYGVDLKYNQTLPALTELFSKHTVTSSCWHVLEIGFGTGSSLIPMAKDSSRKGKRYIGIEVHKPGVATTLKSLQDHDVSNVKLIWADAMEVLTKHFHQGTLFDEVLVLFPDPFPGPREAPRRLVGPAMLAALEPWLRDGATLHVATDVQEYSQHVQAVMRRRAAAAATAAGAAADEGEEGGGGGGGAAGGGGAWGPSAAAGPPAPGAYGLLAERPAWRPFTKYELRGLDLGHSVYDLQYVYKKGGGSNQRGNHHSIITENV